MSDYEKLKATELKTLLKDRGIAATGLTKKAQYIQALIEEDERTNNVSDDASGEPATEDNVQAEEVGSAGVQEVSQAVTPGDDKAAVEAADVETGDATVNESEDVAEQAAAASSEQQLREEKPAETNQTPAAVEEAPTTTADQSASLDRKRKRDTSATVEEQDTEATPKKARAEKDTDETMQDAPVETRKDSGSDSQHEPTAALYIRNLMRPLQLSTLSEYLAQLAGSDITRLHLDAMKTHAFAVFESTAAATSVRDQLHNRVWPEESQRKSLWIDFVPEQKVHAWIDQEDNSGRDIRFEVTYTTDSNGTVEASLIELGGRPSQQARAPASPQATGQGMPGAPQGPRGHRGPERAAPRDFPRLDQEPEQASKPPPPPQQQQQQGGSFSKLDQYFSFTNAKPKIYFKPVEKGLADARLAEFDRETSRDWQGGRAWNRSTRLTPVDQLRRYTFEDGDKVVDGGVDFGGFGKRQFAGGTGPFIPGGPSRGRGGRGGGGGGGGYRGGY